MTAKKASKSKKPAKAKAPTRDAALRDANWRLESIIEGTHVGTWEWNVQTGETVFNKVWAQIVGYTLDELAPISIRTWETLAHPDDLKQSGALLERHFAGTLPYYDYESRMRHKDGHWVWVHDRGRVMSRTGDGKPLMMFGTHTDITERKRAEEALKATNAKLARAQRIAHIGSWEDHLPTGELHWSEEMFSIMGLPPSNSVNLAEAVRAFPPEELDRFGKAVRAATDEGAPYSEDYRIVRPDGSMRHIHDEGEIVCDEQGKATWMYGTTQDITERKRAEEALRESEEKFRTLFETSPIGIDIFDTTGRLVHANPAALAIFGLALEDQVKGFDLFADPNLSDVHKAALLRGETVTFHVRFDFEKVREPSLYPTTRRGIIELDLMIQPLSGGRGYQAIVQDITERKRAEEALQYSLSQWKALAEHSPFLISTIDRDGVFRYVNKVLPGLDMQKLLGASSYDFIAPEHQEFVRRSIAEVFATGATAQYELKGTGADGRTETWYATFLSPIVIEGKVVNATQMSIDITERKRTEEALRERQSRLEDTQKLAKLGSWSWDIATDSVTWTEELFRIAGRDPAGPAPTYAEHPQMYTSESFARLSAAVDRALALSEPYELDLELVRPDGAHRGVTARGEAVRDAAGRVVGLRGMLLDITERRQAEEARALSEERLSEAQAVTKVGSWETDLATLQVAWSTEVYRIFDIDPDSFQASHPAFLAFVHPEDRARVDAALFESFDRRTLNAIEHRIVTPGGLVKFVEERWRIYRDEQGRPVRARGTCQDISERKRTDDEREALLTQVIALQKLESVGRLAGGVAHDFNNSLQIVLLNIEMLLASRDLSDISRQRLLDIQEAARHSAAQTAQLLAFARRQVVRAQVLNLNDTTQALVPTLQRLVGESIPVEWRPGAELWPVSLDPSQYQQVLVNLATNARDALRGNGHLTIATANVTSAMADGVVEQSPAPGEYVRLVVTDDGPGMSGETLEHLFEPFYTTKGVGEGTGLGLASVFGIVKQNGGTIAVDSALGRGTTVTIHWPRLVTAEKLPAETPPILAPPRGTETVLIVEDEPKILAGCVSFLEALGYTVLSAKLPSEALRVAEVHSGPIQLLLTDVVMPEMSGHALAARLTATRPTLRRLYMTGYSDSVQRQLGMDESIRLLNKPFTLDAMAHAVRAALDET